MLKFKTLAIKTLVMLAAGSFSVQAAFDNPNSNSNNWGGWSRGATGTMYAEWDRFETYLPGRNFRIAPDSTPDVGSNNTTSAIVTVTSGTPIPVGSGNIYSPTTALGFSLVIRGNIPRGPKQVALQLASTGREFNYSGIRLNGLAYARRVELSNISLGAGLGAAVESLLIWNLAEGVDSYKFTFSAAATSLGLDKVAVDIGPVPLPAAAWMLLSGLAGVGFFTRRSTQAVAVPV